jgi:hypothetical protein
MDAAFVTVVDHLSGDEKAQECFFLGGFPPFRFD